MAAIEEITEETKIEVRSLGLVPLVVVVSFLVSNPTSCTPSPGGKRDFCAYYYEQPF